MAPELVTVSSQGAELVGLATSLLSDGRTILGITGAPGSGKSLLASALVGTVGRRAALVPMDGFHLGDAQLRRLSLLQRKGAPETFDAWGYTAALARVRGRPDHQVYVPGFERDLEQPLAAALVVEPGTGLIVTDGNYLLLPGPEWQAVAAQLDQVWFVQTDEALRRDRLVARHVASGKTLAAAIAWVERVDEPNARLIAAGAQRADVVLDLTSWRGTLAV
ncbi:MAG: nucleoside/nucleotide kinase family protein [Nocardioidaceae bacterium]